jgi:ABC-2 type transport system ATP-binding protein
MITVEHLTKTFGPKRAVDDVTFTVEKGEVLGFLGPNGAGKSTTMRMITGFIPPSAGSVRVGRHDMLQEPILAKRLIGYLPENAPAYTDMTVYGFLGFTAELRGLRGQEKKKAVHRVVETCFLESVLHQSVETLSKGYRHRTCFAQSIIHDPEVLVLDEPTDGLDPNQKHEVRQLIRRMGATKAIVFSTHILEEVDAACTRAIIIDRGRIVANGTPSELRQRSEQAGAVVIRVAGVDPLVVVQKLGQMEHARKAVVLREAGSDGAMVRVFPHKTARNGGLARGVAELALREGWKLEELHTEEGRLDEVFRGITRPDTVQREKAAA